MGEKSGGKKYLNKFLYLPKNSWLDVLKRDSKCKNLCINYKAEYKNKACLLLNNTKRCCQ